MIDKNGWTEVSGSRVGNVASYSRTTDDGVEIQTFKDGDLGLCREPHPSRKGVYCTLPAGHGPVIIGGVRVAHVYVDPDTNEPLAWRPSDWPI